MMRERSNIYFVKRRKYFILQFTFDNIIGIFLSNTFDTVLYQKSIIFLIEKICYLKDTDAICLHFTDFKFFSILNFF